MVVRPLKGYRSFEDVLRSGRRVTSGPLLLAALPGQDGESETLVGVGVPKRVARKAVTRNRIKRLMRVAVIGTLANDVPELEGSRVVCLWRNAPEHPAMIRLSDVERHVRNAVQKLTLKGRS